MQELRDLKCGKNWKQKVKSRLNPKKACYPSVQNLSLYRLLPNNIKAIYKTIILPAYKSTIS
jgi:hypothetical protein